MNKYIVAIIVFISRLKYLPANISTLGSFGLFGSFPLFILNIFLFDLFIGGFYSGVIWNYLAFLVYPLLGLLIKKNFNRSFYLIPTASVLFFLISNFGVWFSWYPHTIEGLVMCYTLAIPFYKNTLIGDFLFGYGYVLYKYVDNQRLVSTYRKA